jgi:hypothetical protein
VEELRMGEIIYKALIKVSLAIPTLWYLIDKTDYKLWWIILIAVAFGFIVMPAVRQFEDFNLKNSEVLEKSICSSCRHFDKSSVLCMKYDKQLKPGFIPCEGNSWEQKND